MTSRKANANLPAEITVLRDRVVSLTGEVAELHGALAQAGERQKATSEILRLVSSSPTNLQVARDAIATNADRVCGAYDATVLLQEGELVRRAPHDGPLTSGRQDLVSINQGFVSNRSIRDANRCTCSTFTFTIQQAHPSQT